VEGRNEGGESSGYKGRISVKTSGRSSSPEQGEQDNRTPGTIPEHSPRHKRRSETPPGGAIHRKHSAADQRAPEGLPAEEKLNTVYRLTTSLAQQMEKSRIAEYTELLHSPWRLIWLNVLSGTARGLGIALGFTFFAATIIYVLQLLGALNLPIIGDYIADIVRIVQHQLELKTF
jgi:hypothetical protein